MTVRFYVGFISRHLQSAGCAADIRTMAMNEEPSLPLPTAVPSRDRFAWCLLVVWMLASAAVLYQHMADNPPGLCRTGGAAVR